MSAQQDQNICPTATPALSSNHSRTVTRGVQQGQDPPVQRSSPRIIAVNGVLPANQYEQGPVTEVLEQWLAPTGSHP